MNNIITICFAVICKNNEKTIVKMLESAENIITDCIILDIGSTDDTCKLIHDFFKNKDIQYKIYNNDDKGILNNKIELFNLCHKKTDYILHFEHDEYLNCVNFSKEYISASNDYIGYYINIYEQTPMIDTKIIHFNENIIKTNNKKITNSRIVLFNNKYKWKIIGDVFHKYIPINVDELDFGYISNKFLHIEKNSNENTKDIMKTNIPLLKKLYLDTIHSDEYTINSSCIFHIAQSYYYLEDWNKALLNYLKYTKLKDASNDELYQSYIKIVEIMYILNYNVNDLLHYTTCAINLCNHRAESYYQLGNIFIENNNYDLGYFCFKKAQSKNLEEIYKKATSYIDEFCYDNHVNYSLALCCLHTERKDEGITLLNEIDISKYNKNEIDSLKKRLHQLP
jgi:hypothetical protein